MEGCRLTLVLSALSCGMPRHAGAARQHLQGLGQVREARKQEFLVLSSTWDAQSSLNWFLF